MSVGGNPENPERTYYPNGSLGLISFEKLLERNLRSWIFVKIIKGKDVPMFAAGGE